MGRIGRIRSALRTSGKRALRRLGFDVVRYHAYPKDFTTDEIAVVRAVRPYTMTSPERIVALTRAVEYVVRNDIPGDIVECGVWRGGSMLAVAMTLRRLGAERDLHLFDTFEGMPPPTEADVYHGGGSAADSFRTGWLEAPLDAVRELVLASGYPAHRVRFVKGTVETSLPDHAPERIALLRLDTDWYVSTAHELKHLYPRLARGGVLIIDDYGEWSGARRAVDEYLQSQRVGLLLARIDTTGRIAVRP